MCLDLPMLLYCSVPSELKKYISSEKDVEFNRLVEASVSMDDSKCYKEQVLAIKGTPKSWSEDKTTLYVNILKLKREPGVIGTGILAFITSESAITSTKFEKYYSDDTVKINSLKFWFNAVPVELRRQLRTLRTKVISGLQLLWSSGQKTSIGCTDGDDSCRFQLEPKEVITSLSC